MLLSLNKRIFYHFFTVVSLFLFLFVAAPVFSQAPQLGQPSLLQQTLNILPAVPVPGVGSVNFQFGGKVWMAKLNGQNLLAGTIEEYETNEGSILVLKQTHTYAKVTWVKTPGADINLEYKNATKTLSVIPKADLDAKLAAAKAGGASGSSAGQASAGQTSAAASASLPQTSGYDDEKDFTVEAINEGSAARITRYVGKNTEIKIPPRIGDRPVTEIGDRAFTRKGLTSVVLPESVIFIGNLAFSENPIGTVSIGANVYIANNAFDSAGYNSFTAVFYNNQGRRAGIYSNSWRFVSAVAPTGGSAVATQPQQASAASATASKSAVVFAGNGHRYEVINKSMTWTKAKEDCEKRGGYLATITSKEEQEFIKDLIKKSKAASYWLGGYREDKDWKWVTGETFSFTNWLPGQPDNTGGHENYLMCVKQGQWNDNPNINSAYGNSSFGYICEWD